ncbi:hypothetical protein, partial [Novosphingobium sp. SCN 63-17]
QSDHMYFRHGTSPPFYRSRLDRLRGDGEPSTTSLADNRIGCNHLWMKRIAFLVTYAVVLTISYWIFYLNLDWRSDQTKVPTALMLFVVFALASLIVLIARGLWWLPGALMLIGFTVIPLALQFSFKADYIVWVVALAVCASMIGWFARLRQSGS